MSRDLPNDERRSLSLLGDVAANLRIVIGEGAMQKRFEPLSLLGKDCKDCKDGTLLYWSRRKKKYLVYKKQKIKMMVLGFKTPIGIQVSGILEPITVP